MLSHGSMRIERYLDGLGRAAITRALGVEASAALRATTDPKHGDYQLNGILPLSKQLRQNPRAMAENVLKELVGQKNRDGAIDHAEVAG
ncbi:MAG: Arginyl-tRNA synthetase, partial [Myxococcaceae bacterium]|nr:Arginyl-tRNA synthetase [Myxococcaceae bacterium]